MKTKDKKLEDFIERCKIQNNGKLPQMIGSNGFTMDLTIENYEKLKKDIQEQIDRGDFEKHKKTV